jgi:very-short-patch-repair endonuclease
MTSDELDRWARLHHGLVAKQATGMSDSAWLRAVAAGRLIPIHPGVARLPGTAITREQRICAAVLAAGAAALASHRSAASLWGVARPPNDPVDLIVPDRPSLRRMAGVRFHRPSDVRDLDGQRCFGIPTTCIERTLLDLGAVDARSVPAAVGHALTVGLCRLDDLERTVRTHSARGRRGITALRAAIEEWRVDAKPADSVLEPAMMRIVRRYALPPVVFHPVIEGYEVDFRMIGLPIVLECDGWTSHGLERQQFERDRRRDAVLAAAGWVVLRFSYRAITLEPRRTADRIRAAVARWSSVRPPDAA